MHIGAASPPLRWGYGHISLTTCRCYCYYYYGFDIIVIIMTVVVVIVITITRKPPLKVVPPTLTMFTLLRPRIVTYVILTYVGLNQEAGQIFRSK